MVGDEPELPYDRPPLSKQVLRGEWEPADIRLRSATELAAWDVDLRLGVAAAGLDTSRRTVGLADGSAITFDALVVATGVRARRLSTSAGVHTIRTLGDAVTLRGRLRPGRRLVIVGAGFVGVEVAATARRLGAEVTLLESGPLPLARTLGAAAGHFVTGLHTEHGVEVRSDAQVAIIERAGVCLVDGTVVPADDVLVAVGSVPNIEWLADSGLDVHDGLLCDEYCAAAPGVYAAGDVARWHNPLFGTTMRIEHRTNAAEQGIAVARNLLDPGQRRSFAPVPYFWSDQYDVKLQAYGDLRHHDEALVLDSDLPARQLLVAYRKGDRLVGVLAVGKPPKELRAWRALIESRSAWTAATTSDAA